MMKSEIEERWIMVKAQDSHVILKEDSIDEPCATPFGAVMAPRLACNVLNAVGRLASEFNHIGRQVWAGKMMKIQGSKIIRD